MQKSKLVTNVLRLAFTKFDRFFLGVTINTCLWTPTPKQYQSDTLNFSIFIQTCRGAGSEIRDLDLQFLRQ